MVNFTWQRAICPNPINIFGFKIIDKFYYDRTSSVHLEKCFVNVEFSIFPVRIWSFKSNSKTRKRISYDRTFSDHLDIVSLKNKVKNFLSESDHKFGFKDKEIEYCPIKKLDSLLRNKSKHRGSTLFPIPIKMFGFLHRKSKECSLQSKVWIFLVLYFNPINNFGFKVKYLSVWTAFQLIDFQKMYVEHTRHKHCFEQLLIRCFITRLEL